MNTLYEQCSFVAKGKVSEPRRMGYGPVQGYSSDSWAPLKATLTPGILHWYKEHGHPAFISIKAVGVGVNLMPED